MLKKVIFLFSYSIENLSLILSKVFASRVVSVQLLNYSDKFSHVQKFPIDYLDGVTE